MLKPEDKEFLTKFSGTRRVKRKGLDAKYGVDGEFFVDGAGPYGQDEDETVVDYNTPPATQPGLWCQWVPNDDGTAIVWDEGEKFYEYVEWIKYLIDKILAPRGYTVTGGVEWQGEDPEDRGLIVVRKNKVFTRECSTTYGPEVEA